MSDEGGTTVLIVDGKNRWVRAYASSGRRGGPGGPTDPICLFVAEIANLVGLFRPDRIVVAWDWPDTWRTEAFDEYKAGRDRSWADDLFEGSSDLDMHERMVRCSDYLWHLPVAQILIPGLEADDIIGHVATVLGSDAIIVSTDRDMWQFASSSVVWDPGRSRVVGASDTMSAFGCHPSNVVPARSLIGDASDRIPGVRGIGPAWVRKRLPELSEPRPVGIGKLRELLQEQGGKVAQRARDEFDDVRRYWDMMDLANARIDDGGKREIGEIVADGQWKFDPDRIVELAESDGLGRLVASTMIVDPFREFSERT